MNSANPATLKDSLKTISAYKYALDQADIVAITDPRGVIGYVNENFCKISGYSADELIGNDHRIINSGHHSKEFMRNIWQTISAGKVWKGEIKNKARNGTYYWVDTTIVPFPDDNGRPYQYMAIRHDITAHKQIEEQLKATNTELETFSYMVAHDLRAPLRIINGLVSILNKEQGERMTEDGKEVLNMINENTTRMARLIDDLLRFSRLGAASITPVYCDVRNIVDGVISSIKEEGKEIKAEIIISDLPSAKCDFNLAVQVWANLISNAVKYSEHIEHPVIEIGGYQSGTNMIYFVKDNGVGFDMKNADLLFKVFQRLHTDKEFKGTGIGLAIADRIIKKHGGHIWAHAEEGKGAVFYFSLPL